MRKYFFVLLLALVFILGSNVSGYDLNVHISSPSGSSVDGYVAYYSLSSNSSPINGSTSIENSFFVISDLSEGDYVLKVELDDLDTEDYDYFGSTNVVVGTLNSADIFVLPVGSLDISVVDSIGRPINRALIRIDCSKNYGAAGYYRTDSFGIVSINNLPESSCLVRSAVENHVKSERVNIVKGDRQVLRFAFDDVSNSSLGIWYILLAAVILVVLYWLIFQKKVFNVVLFKKAVADNKSLSASKEDILTALNSSERDVVEFLLSEKEKSGERDFFVNQASIVYGAGIPKTTLVRLLKSLAKKKILVVEKVGKSKRIGFTDWFNEK